MTEKALDRGPINGLIIILPLTLILFVVYTFWPLLVLFLLLNFLGTLWQNYQWQQWVKKINPIFNQLITANKGCLTVLDLSVKANITGTAAKRFLEYKVQEYGAQRKTYPEKGTLYYFLTASALGSILDDSEPLWELDEEDLELKEPQSPTPTSAPPKSPPDVATQSQDSPPHSDQQVVEEATVQEKPSSPAPPPEKTSPSPDSPEEKPRPELAIQSVAEVEVLDEEETTAPEESEPEEETTTPEASAPEAEPEEASINTFTSKIAGLFDSTDQDLELSELIQADLAKRLDVHASTVGKHKLDQNFSEWSQSRDPDGVAWIYSKRKKMFIPQLNNET